MKKYERYEKYKDSGIEWIGEIPEEWEVSKISHSFNMIGSGTTPTSGEDDYYSKGTINWINTGDLNNGFLYKCENKITKKALKKYSTLRLYKPGTVIIALYGATIGKTSILKIEGCTNQACCALSESKFYNNSYVFNCLKAAKEYIINLSNGGSQPNISQNTIRSLRLPLPPLKTQNKIVQYLDKKQKQANTFIEKQKKIIELLKEKKKAIINEAVTKGINKDVKMKDSGIEWIGEIPEDWEVRKLKFIVSINQNNLNEKTKKSQVIKYLDISSIGFNYLKEKPKKMKFSDAPSRARRIVKRGDTIISTVRTYLKSMCFIDRDINNCIVSTGFAVLSPKKEIFPEILNYVLSSDYFINQVTKKSIGISYPAISENELSEIKIAVPNNLEEQKALLDTIRRKTKKIDQYIQKAEKSIEIIKEYFSNLIFHIITGKCKTV